MPRNTRPKPSSGHTRAHIRHHKERKENARRKHLAELGRGLDTVIDIRDSFGSFPGHHYRLVRLFREAPELWHELCMLVETFGDVIPMDACSHALIRFTLPWQVKTRNILSDRLSYRRLEYEPEWTLPDYGYANYRRAQRKAIWKKEEWDHEEDMGRPYHGGKKKRFDRYAAGTLPGS